MYIEITLDNNFMHHNILEKLAFAQNGVALLTFVKPITKEPTITRENAK